MINPLELETSCEINFTKSQMSLQGEKGPATSLFPMLRRENWPSSSLFPCRDLEIFQNFTKCQMSLQGEKVPTTGLLRPGRREGRPATALSPISTYTPLGGSTGERGPSTSLVPILGREKLAKLESLPCRDLEKL